MNTPIKKIGLLPDSWRFQIACDSYSSFEVSSELKDKLSAFSSLYNENNNKWVRKFAGIPNLDMALSIGMPIHESMRSVIIQMEQLRDGIDGVAENINIKLKEHGLIPETCKIMVLASLQLRDISDPTSWASKPFPNTPAFFYSDNITDIKERYDAHINALKAEFPKAQLSDFQTVTSSLCDGSSDISSLLVMEGNNNSYVKVQNALRIIVDEKELKKVNTPLTSVEYSKFYESMLNSIDNKYVIVYATMLLGFLKYWDVMVITANNICLKGDDSHPRGLAGFILCFERGKEVVQFFPLADALFAPLIHLYAKAALLEGAQHFYDTRKSTSQALREVTIAIENLQSQRNKLHEHVSGSYGEDLARFRDDFTFKNKDNDSLVKKAFYNLSSESKSQISTRGIWHTPWNVAKQEFNHEGLQKTTRLDLLKNWLRENFSARFLHLSDDKGFKRDFLEEVDGIKDEKDWNKYFSQSGDKRLELLMLSRRLEDMKASANIMIQPDSPKYMFYGFEVFWPHLENILFGIKSNFQEDTVEAKIDKCMFVVRITRQAGSYFTEDGINEFIVSVKQDETLPYAEWTRTRFMPIMWNKLYHRKAEVAWLNDTNDLILTVRRGQPSLGGSYKQTRVSEFRFFFDD